jgi:hypothetical protein
MPAITSLVLADGQGSPANHTFVPVTTTGQKAQWAERVGAGPAFWPTVENSVVTPNSKPGAAVKPYTVTWSIYLPVSVTSGGATQLDHFHRASINFYFAPNSTDAERADLVAYAKNLLATAAVIDSAKKVEPWY